MRSANHSGIWLWDLQNSPIARFAFPRLHLARFLGRIASLARIGAESLDILPDIFTLQALYFLDLSRCGDVFKGIEREAEPATVGTDGGACRALGADDQQDILTS